MAAGQHLGLCRHDPGQRGKIREHRDGAERLDRRLAVPFGVDNQRHLCGSGAGLTSLIRVVVPKPMITARANYLMLLATSAVLRFGTGTAAFATGAVVVLTYWRHAVWLKVEYGYRA